jgi:hypothetical protein
MHGRLYSRMCGWENGSPVKSYNSDTFDMFSETENDCACDGGHGGVYVDMDGKTGSFIANYMDDATRDLKRAYERAYKLCKLYPSWYFYYGDFKVITSAQSI